MTTKPDVPAAARLMEAARSLRLHAESIRRAHPPRRASSAGAEVDVDADGRLLALRVLDPNVLRAGEWSQRFTQLYRAALGDEVEGAVVQDLTPEQLPQGVAGLGPGRFEFPPGIDSAAPPAMVMAQVNTRLRARFAAAESASRRVAELDGIGRSAHDEVMVRIGARGQLLELRTTSHLTGQPMDEVNALLGVALQEAREDLRRQIDSTLDEEGL